MIAVVSVVVTIIAVRPGKVSSAWTAVIVIIPFIIGTDVRSSATASAIIVTVAAVIGAITVALRAHGSYLRAYMFCQSLESQVDDWNRGYFVWEIDRCPSEPRGVMFTSTEQPMSGARCRMDPHVKPRSPLEASARTSAVADAW